MMAYVLLGKGNEDVEDLVQWFLKRKSKLKVIGVSKKKC